MPVKCWICGSCLFFLHCLNHSAAGRYVEPGVSFPCAAHHNLQLILKHREQKGKPLHFAQILMHQVFTAGGNCPAMLLSMLSRPGMF